MISENLLCRPRARTWTRCLPWLFLFAVLASTDRATAAGVCFPPPSGLVGWWPGDGSALDIASTNNGTLQGGATASAVGMVGTAFSFNGTTSYVQIPDAPALKPTNLTVEAWVKFASLTSTGSGGSPAGQQYIVFKQNTRSGNFEGYYLAKERRTGGDVFVFTVSSSTGASAEADSTAAIATNVWYHIAGVRGSNFVQIYVNGVLAAQSSVTFAQNYGTEPLYFGTSGESYWDHKFNGLLDEVSLYNRALASNEIASIYAAGASGKCKGNITPVAVNDGYTVTENTVLNVPAPGVLANDSDADGDALTAVLSTGVSHGALTLNANGSFTYTPATNYTGADSFTYTASDGLTNSAPATVSLTVTRVNLVPVAVNDAYTNNQGTTLNVAAPGVLANDSDADGDALTAVLATSPAHGSLTLNANGSFSYTPVASYSGLDSFTYTANDGLTNSAPATVSLTVVHVNLVPVAVNDGYTVTENTVLNVTSPGVLANDSDADGDALTAVLSTGVSHGALTLNANGSFTYTPATNYTGADSFTYTASDGLANSAPATASITVTRVNLVPVAVNDAYTNNENTVLTVVAPGVLGNDTDADGDPLTAVLGTGPAHGALTLNANGSFTYAPATNYYGSDSFTYRANDGITNSGLATVSLTVQHVNQPPVAVADSYTVTQGGVLNVAAPGVLANDTDVDGNPLTAVLATSVSHGTLTLNTNGSFTYTPATNFSGADSFTYMANDGTTNSAPATVSITVSPLLSCISAPANLVGWWPGDGNANDITSTNNGSLQGGATDTAVGKVAQAFSFNGTNSFVQIPDAPALKPTNLTIEAWVKFTSLDSVGLGGSPAGQQYIVFKQNTRSGSFEGYYLAKERRTGGDIFVFTVSSSAGVSAEADSTAAIATNVWYHIAAVRGPSTLQIYVNGALAGSASVAFPQDYGTLPLYFGTSGQSYWDHKFNGLLDEVSLYNRALASNEIASIYAAGANGKCKGNVAPVAVNDSYTLPQDTVLSVPAPGVLANDTDANGNALTAVLGTGPTNGSLTLNANGSFTYTPSAGYHGPDAFTYTANDGLTNSGLATVSITVQRTDHPPVAVNDAYSMNQGTTLTVAAPGVLGNDTDVDGDPLTAVVATGPAHGTLTLNANGSFTYTPVVTYSGADSFTYMANDGISNSAPATVNLTILFANVPPVAVADSYTMTQGGALSVTAPGVLANDTDANGNSLTAVLATGVSHGALTLNANGSFTYTPPTNFSGADSFTYMANDGTTNSAPATVGITVSPLLSCVSAPANLVGWWPGDGNANDIASTDNGSLQGGATAGAIGKVGPAFSFDGTNSFVQIPDAPALKPTNLTIEAWVKFTSLDSVGSGGSPAGEQYIVFKQNTRSGNFEGYYLGKERQGGMDYFVFSVSSATGAEAEADSTAAIATNVWYHVAAVRGPSTLQLYVNGVLAGSASVGFAQDYGTLPLYFGTSGQSYWDHKLSGTLDEVSLYNRALTAAEISAIYNAGANGKCKVPVPPTIVTQPANQVLVVGGSAAFSVTAAGTAPLGYQWYKDAFKLTNSATVAGATNAGLSLSDLQLADVGNYSVVVSNSLGTTNSLPASLNTGVPPANDNFASAQVISGASGSVTGNNANASKEPGEPNHAGNAGGSSVWYNWTAPSTSPVTFDTCLSGFDTLLAVYTGNAVNALTQVAANANINSNNYHSRLTFTPVSGTVYHIAVDGANGANGNLTLRWANATTPLPDLSIVGSAVAPAISTETFAPTSCAVLEGLIQAGTRTIIRFNTETENSGTADLFFGNPANNPLFVWAPCHAHYHFQNYMSYRLRDANGNIAAIGLKVGFCILDVFRWQSGAPNNAKYSCTNQGIQVGWGDLYDSTLDGQWIDITGLPPGNYTIEIEANPQGIIQEANYGNNITTVPIAIGNPTAPPLNDNFASPQALLGGFSSVGEVTSNATKEAGEPNHAGNSGGHSVWFQWTAPSTKSVTIDTIGSSFNTLLAVYTGSTLTSLNLVASNDDIGSGITQSRVTFSATAGTTYDIAVDGFNGAAGNLVLTLDQTIQNDNFANCQFVGGVSGIAYGANVGATKETNEPNHAGDPGGASIWYCWTAPINGTVTFSTAGSAFSTLLAAYTGPSVDQLSVVASNSASPSSISFSVVGLTMYHIAIDGPGGVTGDTTLTWNLVANQGVFVANAQAISQPGGPRLSSRFLSEGEFQLAIAGLPDQHYRIETSCDLQHWVPGVTTVADDAGVAWFIDKTTMNTALRSSTSDPVCNAGQVTGASMQTTGRYYRAIPVTSN